MRSGTMTKKLVRLLRPTSDWLIDRSWRNREVLFPTPPVGRNAPLHPPALPSWVMGRDSSLPLFSGWVPLRPNGRIFLRGEYFGRAAGDVQGSLNQRNPHGRSTSISDADTGVQKTCGPLKRVRRLVKKTDRMKYCPGRIPPMHKSLPPRRTLHTDVTLTNRFSI